MSLPHIYANSLKKKAPDRMYVCKEKRDQVLV